MISYERKEIEVLDGAYYFESPCYFNEHTIRFVLDKGEEKWPPEIYVSFFLEGRGFFHRAWLAIKYISGYKTRYGHFGNWTLVEDDVEKMEQMLQKYKGFLLEWKQKNVD